MGQKNNKRRRKGIPALYWLRDQLTMRPLPIWAVLVSHVLALGIAMILYALPHHVIPHAETAVGIVSSREGNTQTIQTIEETMISQAEEGDAWNETDDIREEDILDEVLESTDQADEMVANGTVEPRNDAVYTEGRQETESSTETAELQTAGALSMEEDGTGIFRQKFADKFTDGEVIREAGNYRSANINVTVFSKYSDEARAMVHVADIYVADVSCVMTAFAQDQYGRGYLEWITDVAKRYKSVVTLNGDYYGCRNVGVIIRNGVLYRDRTARGDIAVLYWDGHMEAIKSSRFDTMTEIEKGAFQSWSFGPSLLDENGKTLKRFNCDANLRKKNPRSAIGYYEPGHYCLVAVDGRNNESHGATMTQLANIMSGLGCKLAYNLDGGQTSLFAAGTKMVNDPSQGGRESSDYIMIVDRISQ